MGDAMKNEQKRQSTTVRRRGQMPGEEGYQALRQSATGKRTVNVPDTVQPSAYERYAQRRNRLYEARTRERTPTHLASRTLAQTGAHAPAGQVRYPRRSLPQQHTPIPVRSGHFKRRRGFLWRIFGLFVGLAVLTMACTYALTGPAFRIEQVSVTGTHSDALLRRIQQMGMQGQNIFLIDVPGLIERIDAIPEVASASLQKQWPNQLVIAVQERVPVLLWQTKYGTYSVDEQGVVIAAAQPGMNHLLTVKDLRTYKKPASTAVPRIQPGDRLNGAEIAFAAQVFGQLPKMTGLATFTLLYDDTTPANNGQGSTTNNGTFVIQSGAGWIAYLGAPGDPNPLSNRLVELQQILTLAQQQQLTLATIDVRYGLRPVYTVKS